MRSSFHFILVFGFVLMFAACQTTSTKRLVLVSAGGASQPTSSGKYTAGLTPTNCRRLARCEMTLVVTNHSQKPVQLSIDNVSAEVQEKPVPLVTPEQLLIEYKADTSESLTAQQFSSPPPRSINDQSLRQRQLAESGRTAAARLEQQLLRLKQLKKITSQMLNQVAILPSKQYTGLIMLDLSSLEAGQKLQLTLRLSDELVKFGFNVSTDL